MNRVWELEKRDFFLHCNSSHGLKGKDQKSIITGVSLLDLLCEANPRVISLFFFLYKRNHKYLSNISGTSTLSLALLSYGA